MRRLFPVIPLILLLLVGCNQKEQEQPAPIGQADVAASAVNEFAFQMYQQLSQENGNLFFSPTSISTALAMTWAGTDGTTAEEAAKVLHLGPNRDQVLADFSQLLGGLAGSDTTFTLSVANRLWGQKEFAFKTDYLSEIKGHFDGGFEACNFKSSPEQERQKINKWVADRTADKIQDLLAPGSLNTNTRLVLTNAVYFLGNWKTPFPVDRTQDETFHSPDGTEVKTPTMKLKKRLPYFADENMAMVTLPYHGDELDFLVVLPNAIDGLAKVSASLNASTLQAGIDAMTNREVDVWLPKLDLSQSINLNATLKEMGLRKIFDEGQADFSRLTKQPGLFVSSVVHKSYLMVDEQGTEAAAATGITIGVTSMPAPPTMFMADHPFLFLIRQKDTGAIIFMGRFEQP